jgi:enhanced entry protein LpnE
LNGCSRPPRRANPGDSYNVGVIYTDGTDTMAPNYDLARLWLDRAAKQDYTSAFDRLGLLYREGLGVTTRRRTAFSSGARA